MLFSKTTWKMIGIGVAVVIGYLVVEALLMRSGSKTVSGRIQETLGPRAEAA